MFEERRYENIVYKIFNKVFKENIDNEMLHNIFDNEIEFKSGSRSLNGIEDYKKEYIDKILANKIIYNISNIMIKYNNVYVTWNSIQNKNDEKYTEWGLSYFLFCKKSGLILKNYWVTSSLHCS